MLFYKIVATRKEEVQEEPQQESRSERIARVNQIKMETESFNNRERSGSFFLISIGETKIYAGALCPRTLRKRDAARFLEKLELAFQEVTVEETTLDCIAGLLGSANRNDFIENSSDFLEAYGLRNLIGHFPRHYREEIVATPATRPMLMKRAATVLSTDLQEELERILTPHKGRRVAGHPVHYIIKTDDPDVFKEMTELLIMALLRAGRIKSYRYVAIDSDDTDDRISSGLYAAAAGGTVIIDFPRDAESESEFADTSMDEMENAINLMKPRHNEVLTIFHFPKTCNKLLRLLHEKAGSCSFLEIEEDTVFGDRAKQYLAAKAQAFHAKADTSLCERIQEGTGYTSAELNLLFDQWLDHHLKNVVYPQYASIMSASEQVKKQPAVGDAYQELQKMVGLGDAKKVIEEALSYYKAQKLFAEKGMQADHPAMHMVFTGNPGTAKTTVARLFAQIMKDNGLLSEGGLYEVGRSDLVGKYVGWTAKIVKEKFQQAKGSVLFIDEAYSLLDDHQGMFGDEAINTIVQEMENNREDMVVIFAGYPEEMEQFLDRNPGLRSRIAYHVPFEDYNAEELYEIAQLTAEKKGLNLAKDIRDKLLPVFESVAGQKDFGNGRYVRNVIEKARMKQAARLVRMAVEDVTKQDICLLLAEDFDIPVEKKKEKVRIGFHLP